jgi:hypothetical protein
VGGCLGVGLGGVAAALAQARCACGKERTNEGSDDSAQIAPEADSDARAAEADAWFCAPHESNRSGNLCAHDRVLRVASAA